MIPKIIHYVWFGSNPFPPKIQKCIDSWKKYLPDYEFKLWNEETFDVNSCQFAKEAFELKKWAFVSDYARIEAIYKYGGWYLDTDIEILKPIAPLEVHRVVLGTDEDGAITAMYGTEPRHPYWKKVLDYYRTMSFVKPDGSLNMAVVNEHLQEVLAEYGYVHKNKYQELKEGIILYPDDYFHVVSLERGTKHQTENSYAIHWQTMTWTSKTSHFVRFIRKKLLIPIFGEGFLDFYNRLRKLRKRK